VVEGQAARDLRTRSRALRPAGQRLATCDYHQARQIALNLWQQALYLKKPPPKVEEVTSIASLAAAYLKHCDGYYLDAERQRNKETWQIRYSVKPLLDLFAALPVAEFGPLRLIELREWMIQRGWSRKLINQRIGRVRRMFKWAVSRQLVSATVYQGLLAVEGLKRGRCMAKETSRRHPVPEADVYAVLPYTTPVVAAMIELQLLTAMRPGELILLRPCDIDRSQDVWHYTPQRHKNEYRDQERIVAIGPRGQEILAPFLLRDAKKYCFSPRESEVKRLRIRHARRITPAKYGNRPGTHRVQHPQTKPSQAYTVGAYGHAIRHALAVANKAIQANARKQGIKNPILIPHWTPYQLRHTAATKVRREMGYETAGAILGHKNMSATAVYAERNQGLADAAAQRYG